MASTLDYSMEEFESILQKTNKIILKKYEQSAEQPGFCSSKQKDIEELFNEPLPRQGMDPLALLDTVEQNVFANANGNFGPNMYGYVISGGNQMSSVADFLASTINQNVAKWHMSPAMTEIEKRVVKWTAEMIGYTPEAGGVMVSGGSAATLAGLTVARNIFFRKLHINQRGLFGIKPFTVYCSTETHNCTDKSVSLLGIGTDQLRRIRVNDDFTINLNALESQIRADIASGYTPFCIIGNAGTVNTGAIDDLEGLAAIAKKHDLWFHIDGAYGGFAASLPDLKPKYNGMQLADSIGIDYHKWLYQPFEVGCTLVRDWSQLREAYFKRAEYLDNSLEGKDERTEFNEHYFQLSRNAKAFKVWMSLKAYGFEQMQAMMQKDIKLARHLESLIDTSDDFELKSKSDLGIVCFRYIGVNLEPNAITEINQKLIMALETDGRIFITGTTLKDEFVLRACIINHRKCEASIEFLISTIREVAEKLMNLEPVQAACCA